MLENLTDKFTGLWNNLKRQKRLTETNIEEGIREIRLALLEADVHLDVVRYFINQIKEQAIGQKIITNVDPVNMFIKIVNDAVVEILGGISTKINLKETNRISSILVCGLQGSGKTTSLAKLAYLLKDGRDILSVSLDIHRPAAAEQLKILSEKAGISYFDRGEEKNLLKIIKTAYEYADRKVKNLILFDSAGRTQVDEDMLDELKLIYKTIKPDENILVCDTMLGQQSLAVSQKFKEVVPIDSLLFTKFDSDSRGGAILSVKKILDIPIKYVGIGEKIDELDVFDPVRVANRILGMGDVVGLVKQAEKAMEGIKTEDLAEKIKQNKFDLGDFLEQLEAMKKMGSMESILSMIPGLSGKVKNINLKPEQLVKMEAVIKSMTYKERKKPIILNNSRKMRISKGSGTSILDVNQLVKKFFEAKEMMRKMSNPKKGKKMLEKFGLQDNF